MFFFTAREAVDLFVRMVGQMGQTRTKSANVCACMCFQWLWVNRELAYLASVLCVCTASACVCFASVIFIYFIFYFVNSIFWNTLKVCVCVNNVSVLRVYACAWDTEFNELNEVLKIGQTGTCSFANACVYMFLINMGELCSIFCKCITCGFTASTCVCFASVIKLFFILFILWLVHFYSLYTLRACRCATMHMRVFCERICE